jgi:hypothetical protein
MILASVFLFLITLAILKYLFKIGEHTVGTLKHSSYWFPPHLTKVTPFSSGWRYILRLYTSNPTNDPEIHEA